MDPTASSSLPEIESKSNDVLERRDFTKTLVDLTGGIAMASPTQGRAVVMDNELVPIGARILRGPGRLTLPLRFSVLTGCANEWGRNVYWRHGTFSLDLETVRSASTCGSPIFTSGPWWVGFLQDAPGRIESDGENMTFVYPEGQELLCYEDQPRDGSAWTEYRRLATARLAKRPASNQPAPHAYAWEYCTWVEQKRLSQPGQHPRTVLNDQLVRTLAERVLKLGLEPGKFTIDDGWQEHPRPPIWTDGYWQPNRASFPDLAKTCEWLRKEGFAPGLWFGMGWYPHDAAIRLERPELFGAWEKPEDAEAKADSLPWTLAASAETETYLRETLRPYAEMGFRKFKFDFFYGERARANALMQTLHRAVRSLDPTIEIEGHHPDFFHSRWCDSVRLNDVLIEPGRDWESLTLAHIRMTRLCAPDRIMNLDHLGGNDPWVGEDDYLRHLQVLDLVPSAQARYPVLSLLPDHFSPAAGRRVVDFVNRHRNQAL